MRNRTVHPWIRGLCAGLAAWCSAATAAGPMTGDLAVSTRIARKLTQDHLARQAAYVLASAAAADTDGYPLPPAPDASASGPTGGGVVPATSAAPKGDGYGGTLGYCAWDNGTITNHAGLIAGEAKIAAITVAVLTPGADGIFQTSCAQVYSGAGAQGDDYVVSYTAGQILAGVQGSTSFSDSVATAADLSLLSASALKNGQVRLVRDDNSLYRYDGTTWLKVSGGGVKTTGDTMTGALQINAPANSVVTSGWSKWIFETTGVAAKGRLGSDGNALNVTTNAAYDGSAWLEDTSTQKKFAYLQHLANGRHEFRTAAAGAGVTWTVGLALNEASATFGLPLVGIDTTPSAWSKGSGTGLAAMDLNTQGALISATGLTGIGTEVVRNAYFNGTGWLAKQTGLASRFAQVDGAHYWFTAPSTSAGSALAFSNTMSLDANGNLSLGTTSAGARLALQSSNARVLELAGPNATGSSYVNFFTAGRAVDLGFVGFGSSGNNNLNVFTTAAGAGAVTLGTLGVEAVRINAVRNVLVGRTTDSGLGQLQVDLGVDLAASSGNAYLTRGGGNVLVGGTTDTGQRLQVLNSLAITAPSGAQWLLMGNQDSAGAATPAIIRAANGALAFGNGTSWSGTGGTMNVALTIPTTGAIVLSRPAQTRALLLERSANTASGLSWYSGAYTAWATYMAQQGQTGVGPTGNLTAPTGTLVTSWALREFVENATGYGWTWESGTSTGNPSIVAELRASDGRMRLAGGLASSSTIDVSGDNYLRLGPNSTWGAYLRVGGNGRVSTTDATVATTNGNLHLDSANGFGLYLNFYAGGTVYGPGGVTMVHTGNIASYRAGGLVASAPVTDPINDGWYRSTGNVGWYSNTYGVGLWAPQSSGGEYGSISTYGSSGGWSGYSISGRVVIMHNNADAWGIYDDVNNRWMLYGAMSSGALSQPNNVWHKSIDGADRYYYASGGRSYYKSGDGSHEWRNSGDATTMVLDSGGNLRSVGNLRSGSNIYADANYGYGLVGVYSDTRYQGVFAMGDSYKLPADGTSTGNLYGIAWTHSNIGGQSKPGLQHQALFMINGATQTAIGSGIWTIGSITANGGINAGGSMSAVGSMSLNAGEGNSYNFWGGGSPYRIAMGYTPALYQYGPVTDYSIKTSMDAGSPSRGFTWGMDGQKPTAALSQSGNFQVAGYVRADTVFTSGQLSVGSGNFLVDGSGVVMNIHGRSAPNGVIRLTPNLHLNTPAGYAVILNWDNGATDGSLQFRIGNGRNADAFTVYGNGNTWTAGDIQSAGAIYGSRVFSGYDSGLSGSVSASNWFRSNGDSGWYNSSYGGGIWMRNASEVEVYNSKAFRVNNYIYGTYLNQSSANDEGGTISQVMVTNGSDNFLRKANMAQLASSLAPYVAASTATSLTVGGVAYAPLFEGNTASVAMRGAGGIILAGSYWLRSDNASPLASLLQYNTAGALVGAVGIGTSSLELHSYMNQPVNIVVGNATTGVTRLTATTTGVQVFGTFTNSSDARLKSNIAALDKQDMLVRLMKLRPVSYIYMNQTGTSLGFLAQDVQSAFPTLVHTGSDGYLSVAYLELIPALTSGMQVHQQMLEDLQARKLDNVVGKWIASSDQKARIFFESNGKTVLRGYGDTAIELRNGEDAPLATFSRSGDLTLSGMTRFSGARGGFAFNPTGTLVTSDQPGEIVLTTTTAARAALRFQQASDTASPSTSRIFGYIFGDASGISLAEPTGKTLLSAGAVDGKPMVAVHGSLSVSNGTTAEIVLSSGTGIRSTADGMLQLEARGLQIRNPDTKEAVASIDPDGSIKAKRFVPTQVVDPYAGCAGLDGSIARDARGQVVVCSQ